MGYVGQGWQIAMSNFRKQHASHGGFPKSMQTFVAFLGKGSHLSAHIGRHLSSEIINQGSLKRTPHTYTTSTIKPLYSRSPTELEVLGRTGHDMLHSRLVVWG